MISNYFKTAFRNLLRNKSYTAINVAGLSLGIAACLLVFLVLRFELSFDDFHERKDRIYRVVTISKGEPAATGYSMGVAYPVPGGLRTDFPQLEKVAALRNAAPLITVPQDGGVGEKKFKEEDGVYFAEPALFEILHFEWLQGSAQTSLSAPGNVVLTKSIAEKYFGSWQAAIGKTIRYDNQQLLKITGILKDIPVNSDFPLKVVMSYETLQQPWMMNDWVSTNGGNTCFVVLPPNMSAAHFNNMLLAFVKRHKPAEYVTEELALQPLSDIHFDARFGNFNHVFSRQMITTMTLIGIFLLIIACVNFINLATAQAVNRSREVGVRKVLGSNRYQLTLQFMGETFLITIFALLLALFIAWLALPLMNQLLGININRQAYYTPGLLPFMAALVIVVTLLSGFYPALVLSGFNPVTALKGRITARMVGGLSLRRGLVILQFIVAQVLIISMLVVMDQVKHFNETFLGFNKEAIITTTVPGDSASRQKMDFVRNRLLQESGVENVSFSFTPPSSDGGWFSDFSFDGATGRSAFSANLKFADAAFFKTYNMQLVAGDIYPVSDTFNGFVVNETMVRKLGFKHPEEILGRQLNFWNNGMKGLILGVVKDFQSTTLREPLQPVVLMNNSSKYYVMNIRLKPERVRATLAVVESTWKTAYPDFIYDYKFLDESLANFYAQENRLAEMFRLFAIIAIFISCLGLYGLISFMVAQRRKEIGIRKVLGASVSGIVVLLSREFTLLIIIAFVLAAPLAGYAMHSWLDNFASRTSLGAGIFIFTIGGSLLIAWITVGLRTIKTAMTNPLHAIRTE